MMDLQTIREQIYRSELPDSSPHIRFMIEAIKEALAAAEADEVPVGAVIVHKNKIIARAHNQRHTLNDPTAHAEMIAITQASEYIGNWRLHDCTMYVTLEPCSMCAGALVLSRIDRLVYGPPEPKTGACESLYQIPSDPRQNHRVEIVPGVLLEPCRMILQDYFAQKRKNNRSLLSLDDQD